MDKHRFERIWVLALPIMGGMVSQNVLNLVDTAMVSRLDNSNAALAAVGLGGFALFVCQALIAGLSAGVQVTAARRKGEGYEGETATYLNAALLIAFTVGPTLSVLLFWAAPSLYPLLRDDPEVIALGLPYLQIRLLGITFFGANFAFRGYWNAIDMARLYMSTLIVMHMTNIALDYVLIFGHFGAPALGVKGAAIASVSSFVLGSGLYFYVGFRRARDNGFLRGLSPLRDIRNVLRIALPNGVQQMFFSAGLLTMFWIIGRVGTAEVAAANVLMNLTLVALLPCMGLGMTATTLVGQALGRGDAGDAARCGWDVAKVAVFGLAILGLPMICIPQWLLTSIYTLEPGTLELALWPLRVVGLSLVFDAVGMVLMNALVGAGAARRVMVTAISCQWMLFLPAAYIVGPLLGYGLLGIWLTQAVYRGLQALVFATFWQRRAWAHIKI